MHGSPDTLALLFLLGVGCAPIVWAASWIRRHPFSPFQSSLVLLAAIFARLLWRANVPPRLPLPPGQGAIVVCNHRSSIDPLFVQLAVDQVVHWLVAREYCDDPVLGKLLAACEVIPVNRSGMDTAATKTALRLVARGELIGMFPEGRINMTDEFMLPARPGAALIAIKANVPIVPCYIEGAPYDGTSLGPLLMSARVRIRVGQPIHPAEFDCGEGDGDRDTTGQAERFMLRVLRAIGDLAGRPDYQPRLAGRKWKP